MTLFSQAFFCADIVRSYYFIFLCFECSTKQLNDRGDRHSNTGLFNLVSTAEHERSLQGSYDVPKLVLFLELLDSVKRTSISVIDVPRIEKRLKTTVLLNKWRFDKTIIFLSCPFWTQLVIKWHHFKAILKTYIVRQDTKTTLWYSCTRDMKKIGSRKNTNSHNTLKYKYQSECWKNYHSMPHDQYSLVFILWYLTLVIFIVIKFINLSQVTILIS